MPRHWREGCTPLSRGRLLLAVLAAFVGRTVAAVALAIVLASLVAAFFTGARPRLRAVVRGGDVPPSAADGGAAEGGVYSSTIISASEREEIASSSV